jgi:uncharacterized protein
MHELVIPWRLYRAVCREVQKFCARHHSAALSRLAHPRDEFDSCDVISDHLVYIGQPARLRRALARLPVYTSVVADGERLVLEIADPAADLNDWANSISEIERAAADVCLRRSIDPFEALATYPLTALFSSAEADAICALRQARPRNRPAYSQHVCIIAKFIRNCNLRCVYCHDWRSGRQHRMTFDTQLALFVNLFSSSYTFIDIVWHGGEPLLLGKRGVLRILAVQRAFKTADQHLRNQLQTNGTLIDQGWGQLLSRYRFEVGVSIDGPPEIHDRTRVGIKGDASYEKVRAGLSALRAHGSGEAGVLIVGTRRLVALGAERLLAFAQAEGFHSVGILPVRPGNGPDWIAGEYLSHTEYTAFLGEIYRARRRNPKPWVAVRELDAVIQAGAGGAPAFCEFEGRCVGRYFSVDTDGMIAHCDKYVGDPTFTLGHVAEQSFSDIASSWRSRSLDAGNLAAERAMAACPHFERCRGWCPHERYVGAHYRIKKDCCGLAPLFDLVGEPSNG